MNDSQTLLPYEPLSAREREILLLLAKSLSDREIADRLVIGLNTVKWYNRQIFQKLQVENRKQAAQRAAALGLLNAEVRRPKPVHNLPAQTTRFVGRDGEVEELSRLLGGDYPRLITLLAPGGMGKTRLALAAAEALLEQFSDGGWFAPLAPLTSPEYIVPAIIEAVRCPMLADERTPMERLCDFLRHKQLLLILDNFEHLVEGAASIIGILQAAPGLKIIVTSRERLNLTSETVYSVGGLRYPVEAGQVNGGEYDAVRMFVEAARRTNPHFDAPSCDLADVCRLVQGMPLAIELAAAWTATRSAAEIAAEIARSADFLRTSMRDVPERLRSIRAVFESAWARLNDAERRVFSAMSVFRGGCTREAAEAVTGADAATLAGLNAKALLWYSAETGRYDIHELLRQYAEAQLESSGKAAAVHAAHQAYFAAFTERWAEGVKNDQINALSHLDPDLDNVRVAFERAISIGTPDALMPFSFVWHYFDVRGRWDEIVRLNDRAIDALIGEDSHTLGRLLAGQSVVHERMYSYKQRLETALASYEMFLRLGIEYELPLPINEYSAAIMETDRARAYELRHQGYEIALKYSDDWGLGFSTYSIGELLLGDGRLDEAERWFSEALELGRFRLVTPWGMAHTFFGMASLKYAQGHYDEAHALFEESLAASRKIGYPNVAPWVLIGLSSLACEVGDFQKAKMHAKEMELLEQNLGREGGLASALLHIANACIGLGEFDEAVRLIHEAFSTRPDPVGTILLFSLAGRILVHRGAYEPAAKLLHYAAAQSLFARLSPFERREAEAALQECHRALPSEELTDTTEHDGKLTIDSALALVSSLL